MSAVRAPPSAERGVLGCKAEQQRACFYARACEPDEVTGWGPKINGGAAPRGGPSLVGRKDRRKTLRLPGWFFAKVHSETRQECGSEIPPAFSSLCDPGLSGMRRGCARNNFPFLFSGRNRVSSPNNAGDAQDRRSASSFVVV